jgi:ribosomal-protein-alanine N-acetyltransferase
VKTAIEPHVRWMIRRDMPSVLEVENNSFDHPWTEQEFIRNQQRRECIGMVAERCEHVVGYMMYELHRQRLHLLSFAVHPDHRRLGIGRAMMERMIAKLSYQRRNRIVVEVRETNLAAQLFFRELGFRAVDILRDYYTSDTGKEDAYLMIYRARRD